jgi:gamma-tubulin complex component 2
VPTFLTKFQRKILLAGKYHNVLCECIEPGQKLKSENDQKHQNLLTKFFKKAHIDDHIAIVKEIEGNFVKANKSLLEMLIKEKQLMGRLKSIKNMFLLCQSDYLTHFLDLAEETLAQPADKVSLSKMRSLLELVLQSQSTATFMDPFRDSFTIDLCQISLFDQLIKINSMVGIDMKKHIENLNSGKAFKISQSLSELNNIELAGVRSGDLLGIDAITLGYNITFPISLILNKKVITKFQMIFRHLFACKYLERCLTFTLLQGLKLSDDSGSYENRMQSSIKNNMAALCSKMLHFVQQMTYYMFFDVIEPHWNVLEEKMSNVTLFDLVGIS